MGYMPSNREIDALIQIESGGNRNAVSKKGARGLVQIMPATAQNPGYGITPLRNNSDEEQRRFARDYLGKMYDKTGSLPLAFAAYNAGLGPVKKAGGIPKIKETQDYVDKAMKLLNPIGTAEANETPYDNGPPIVDKLPDGFKFDDEQNSQNVNNPPIVDKLPEGFKFDDEPNIDKPIDYNKVPWSEVPENFLNNSPTDLVQVVKDVGKGLVETVKHPIDTTSNVLDIIRGEGYKLAKPLPGEISAEKLKRSTEAADNFNKYVIDNYGSEAAWKRSLSERPMRTLNDVTIPVGVGAKLVGGVAGMANLPKVAGASNKLAEVAMKANPINNTVRGAVGMVKDVGKASDIAGKVYTKASDMLRRSRNDVTGAGAADTPLALQREAIASDLPVPMKLTKGMRTRDPMQIQFERENAKLPVGHPLRERMDLLNKQLGLNLDDYVEKTGRNLTDTTEAGRAAVKALEAKKAVKVAEKSKLYQEAEAAGQMMDPVELNGLIKHLNESVSSEALAPILKATKNELVRLGGASVDDAGTLMPKPISISNYEKLRQFINDGTGIDRREIRQSKIMRKLVDADTEGLGGELYKKARKANRDIEIEFNAHPIIKRLLSNKPGTAERTIATENVFQDSILNGSVDEVKHLGRSLKSFGDVGQQAWKEMQGATMQWIYDQTFSNTGKTAMGDQIASADKIQRAVKKLDVGGKLDYIFGKRGAQKIRDLKDLAVDIKTTPEGTVNTSNSSSAIVRALRQSTVGKAVTSVPFAGPAIQGATEYLAERKIRNKIADALNDRRN